MGIAVLIAVIIDLTLGEPKTRRHPVALWGLAMEKMDIVFRTRARRPWSKRTMGALMVAVFVGASFAGGNLLITLTNRLLPGLGWVAHAGLIWLSISVGELVIINKKINRSLESGDIKTARRLLRCLAGRDPDHLNEDRIRRAALESMAENLVDAGIAPLFYAFIGGGALAFTYRIVNTMDSMFGYKNDTYIDFGWAAARLDDIASWLPARLAVAGLALASLLSGEAFWPGIKAALVDGAKHPSPNSGLPMAALAGLLNIRLGGKRLYQGRPVFYGYFGQNAMPIGADTVLIAGNLATRAFIASAAVGILIGVYFQGARWLIA